MPENVEKIRCRNCGNIEDKDEEVSLGEAQCPNCKQVAFELFHKKGNVINPRELRIGNFVAYHGEAVEVKGLPELGLVYFDSSPLPHPHLTIAEEIEPIPLTQEWFTKFLFSHYFYEKEEIKYIKGELEIYGGFETGFKLLNGEEQSAWSKKYFYVHEIQNLYFAIKGEELY